MADSPAVGDLVKSITDDVKALVRGEIELAKAELMPSAKNAGVGAGMFGAAGYFAINAALLLYVAAALGLAALGLPLWLSFVIVAAVLLLLAAVLGLIGLGKVKKIKGPDATVTQAKISVAEVKGAIARGQAAATAPQLTARPARPRPLR
jgi:hypothetical protein